MNFLHRMLLFYGLGCAAMATAARAQEAGDEAGDDQRVQYQLILPDEKTPENVKPEEHNPFESESEAQNRLAPGDTEENRVRDRLLKLPVVGTKRMPDGRMRVLLGNIILETGKTVPPVLPEQLVELKVKNITTEYIELAWQEKRATGLPPKLMVIPINISPRIRYQMLGQTGAETTKGTNATMEMPLRGLIAEPAGASTPPAASQEPAPPKAGVVFDEPPPPAAPAAAEAMEAAAPPLKSTQPTPERVEPPAPAPPPAPAMAAKAPVQPKESQEPRVTLTAPPTPEIPEAASADAAQAAHGITPPVNDATAGPAAPAASSPSPSVESVVRMLFGNPTPAPK